MQNLNTLINFSRIAFFKRKFDKALEYLSIIFEKTSGISEHDKANLYQLQGEIYSKKGQYLSDNSLLQKAIQAFELSKKYLPNNIVSDIKTGEALVFLKNFPEAQNILEKALDFSRKNENLNCEIHALNILAQLSIETRDLNKGKAIIESLELLITEETPAELRISYYQSVMTINTRLHNFDKIFETANISFNLCRETMNQEGEIHALNGIGIVYAIKGEYKKAFDAFWKEYDMSIEIGFRLMTARALVNIGNIFSALHNYEEAAKQHTKIVNEYLEQMDTYSRIVLYYNMGGINEHLGNNEKALSCFLEGLELAKSENIHTLQALLLYEISKLYTDIDLNKAMDFVRQTEKILENHKITAGQEMNSINLAEIYFKQYKYEIALEKGLESLELCKNVSNKKTLTRVYLLLSNIYKMLGTFDRALAFHELYHDLEKELHQEIRKKQMIQLEIQYDLKEKDNEINLLKRNVELQKKELEYANEIAAQNGLIKQANEEIKQFTYAVSHDLKEPLRMIGSFTSLISRKVKKIDDPSLHEYMGFIMDGVGRMTEMLTGMLDYARLGKDSYKQESVNLMKVIKNLILTFRVSIKENNAVITFDEMPLLHSNKLLISQLLQNILGNAIKFRKKDVDPVINS